LGKHDTSLMLAFGADHETDRLLLFPLSVNDKKTWAGQTRAPTTSAAVARAKLESRERERERKNRLDLDFRLRSQCGPALGKQLF